MDLYLLSKVKNNVIDFGQKVFSVAAALKMPPSVLMAIMYHESKLSTTVQNPYTNATGLIQFMPATAKDLGITIDQLKNMTNVQQMDFVYKYLKRFTGKLNDITEAYLAVFYPEAMGKPDSYTFPNYVYKVNKVLDENKDGILTKGDIRAHMENMFPDLKKKLPSDLGA